MILATKSGWLIAVDVVRETAKGHVVKDVAENKKPYRVSKTDPRRKLFDDVNTAMKWQSEQRIYSERQSS